MAQPKTFYSDFRRYLKLKEGVLDRSLWKICSVRCYAVVLRLQNEWSENIMDCRNKANDNSETT